MRAFPIVLGCCFFLSAVAGIAGADELLASVARVDLTPPLSMKAALGGYGERMNKPAEGIHDRVFAKALVLSSGDRKFVIVTADILAFPVGFKATVLSRLSDTTWKPEQVMLLPTHSHASIDMNAIYPRNLLKIPQIGLFHKELYHLTIANIVKVIRDADRDLKPVKVGTTRVRLEGWNHNRRKDNSLVDPELTLTRIDRLTGEPLAILVNWTAHPTFLDASEMMFSGGWPGHMQRTLTALIGGGVMSMYFNGAQGDQSPTERADPAPSASTAPGAGMVSNWEKAERYGRELGIVAWRLWEKTPTSASAALAYHLEPVDLPQPAVHPDFMKTGGSEYGLSPDLMSTILSTMFPRKASIGYLRLGDLLIVGIPGEAATCLGLQIKKSAGEATGIKHPVIGGLANEWVSYILSPEEYDKGGYESSISFYGRTLGTAIVEGAKRGSLHLAGGGSAGSAPAGQ